MSRLHRIASAETNVSIHIDNLTAQSGVTRFTEINANWTYSKDEHLKAGDEELHRFDYLLTEVKNKYSPEMRFLQQTHEKIELIECFSNIGVHYTSLLPIKIRTKPCIMIMKRKPNSVLLKMFFDAEEPDDDSFGGSGDFANFSESQDESELEDEPEMEENEEVMEEPPRKLKRKRLRRSTADTPKSKIKEIIEADRLEALLNLEESDFVSEPVESTEENLEENEIKEVEGDDEEENLSQEEVSEETQDEQESDDEASKEAAGSSSGIKSNIKRIISQEKTKQLIDELKQLDLSAFCDLRQMDAKECLKKILDESTE